MKDNISIETAKLIFALCGTSIEEEAIQLVKNHSYTGSAEEKYGKEVCLEIFEKNYNPSGLKGIERIIEISNIYITEFNSLVSMNKCEQKFISEDFIKLFNKCNEYHFCSWELTLGYKSVFYRDHNNKLHRKKKL